MYFMTTADLNLRSSPAGQILTTMPQHAIVLANHADDTAEHHWIEYNNRFNPITTWLKVTYNNQQGWAAPRYLVPLPYLRTPTDDTFTLDSLLPHIKTSCALFDVPYQWATALIYQESTFKNFITHHDGTGHGLVGLDDNGLLPDFEAYTNFKVGRGHIAITIPPELQLIYLAKTLAKYPTIEQAVRVWHRGPTLQNDNRAYNYQHLLEAHIVTLFS